MIEVLIKCPFEVWKIDDTDCEDSPVAVNPGDLSLIEDYLSFNAEFLDNLINYAELGQLKAEYILPSPRPRLSEFQDGFNSYEKPYIEVKAYSNAESLTDKDLRKIAEFVRGQVLDGWGADGFDLWDNRRLEFDWENVVHRYCKVISDEEFQEDVLKPYQALMANARPSSPDKAPDKDLAVSNLTEIINRLIEELEVLNKEKGIGNKALGLARQLKVSLETDLND